jgi:putative transposase
MLVYEFKLKAQPNQYQAIDEAIRIGQFIRNKCLRYWMDAIKEKKVNFNSMCKLIPSLCLEFPFAAKLNSTARQASVERTWLSVSRFFANCKNKIVGKKGYPKFKKFSRSVEYKKSGWKLSVDRKYLTITDKTGIGSLKLIGTYDLHYYQLEQINRVRLVRRADGYYAQFCIDQERLSRTKKGSSNRKKAHNRLARKHLKVSRQRKDFAVKQARCVITSNDVVAIENLNVKGLVKNHHLSKSISDASWSMFRLWLEYFSKVFSRKLIAVNPAYTSQECSACGEKVKKTLSTRTHICNCGCVLDRDENAAINILAKALNTLGHKEINASGQNDLCLISESLLNKLNG